MVRIQVIKASKLAVTAALILLAIAMNLLGIRKTKTADYLPALFLPILICWLLSLFGIRL